jgi:hypothetical protein
MDTAGDAVILSLKSVQLARRQLLVLLQLTVSDAIIASRVAYPVHIPVPLGLSKTREGLASISGSDKLLMYIISF